MGIIYYVGCRDCKIYRNLGKAYNIVEQCETRRQALALSKKIEECAFHETLLVTFMQKHSGHNCTVFNDSAYSKKSTYPDFLDSMDGTIEDIDYWGVPSGE
jgi:3-dehydroquinate dehydratase